jgi:hypothetical protein
MLDSSQLDEDQHAPAVCQFSDFRFLLADFRQATNLETASGTEAPSDILFVDLRWPILAQRGGRPRYLNWQWKIENSCLAMVDFLPRRRCG